MQLCLSRLAARKAAASNSAFNEWESVADDFFFLSFTDKRSLRLHQTKKVDRKGRHTSQIDLLCVHLLLSLKAYSTLKLSLSN